MPATTCKDLTPLEVLQAKLLELSLCACDNGVRQINQCKTSNGVDKTAKKVV